MFRPPITQTKAHIVEKASAEIVKVIHSKLIDLERESESSALNCEIDILLKIIARKGLASTHGLTSTQILCEILTFAYERHINPASNHPDLNKIYLTLRNCLNLDQQLKLINDSKNKLASIIAGHTHAFATETKSADAPSEVKLPSTRLDLFNRYQLEVDCNDQTLTRERQVEREEALKDMLAYNISVSIPGSIASKLNDAIQKPTAPAAGPGF